MNNIVVKTEWVKSWSENGVGWVQLNHENKLNPLSAGFILAIKEAAEKFDRDTSIGCIGGEELDWTLSVLFDAMGVLLNFHHFYLLKRHIQNTY